jgi:hypothetical protein
MLPTTTQPIFTPEQCKMIIDAGHQCKPEEAKVGGGVKHGKHDTKKRVTTISWIPFDKLPQMYKVIENQLSIVNLNHFYFDGVQITEPAQFTVYPKKGFYDWHMDLNAFGQDGQNPITKDIYDFIIVRSIRVYRRRSFVFRCWRRPSTAALKTGTSDIFCIILKTQSSPS